MSEVIITPEMREDAKKCNSRSCMDCKMPEHGTASKCVEALASLPGVWDEAPEGSDVAEARFWRSETAIILSKIDYTRTLPKSLEDEIAEKYSFDTPSCHPMINGMRAIEVIKSALKEYNERQGK